MKKYKEFKIGDLFNITTGRDIIINSTTAGNIPLISHQHENNGIVRYINKIENRRLFDYETTLALADRGVFYATTQKENFYIGTRVKALTFKDGKKSEKIRLFFVTAINKLQEMFKEYLENATDKLPNLFIELPVNDSDEIDYVYMEQYIDKMQEELINNIKEEHIKLTEKYLKELSLNSYELSREELKIIDLINNDKIQYKNIKIGEIFSVESSKKKYNANAITFGGKYPYVVRSGINNGIRGYITEDERFLNPQKTISFGQDTATIFYQEDDYFTGDKIKILKFKYGELDKNLAFYFVTAMRKSFQNFSWGQSSFNEQLIRDTEIQLPYKNNSIDYDFIKSYITIEQKESIREIIEEKEEKLVKITELIQK